MTDIIEGSIYDFPKYYDLLFGSDWKAEFDFLQECFPKHCKRKLKRVFEPACGTGRLLVKLAQAGYEVGGNDLNEKAIDFCNARFKRMSLPETAFVGDMADFKVQKKFDAAFNFINTFRHLPTEAMAVAHLKCMANAMHLGGIYCLGLHLLPTRGERMQEEAWTARRGNLQINSYMWSKGLDTKGRNEPLGITLDIYTPTKHQRIVDHMDYRTYTKRQFDALLKKVPEFEIEATYDFAYEVSQPITVDASTEDVVYVLRKRQPA